MKIGFRLEGLTVIYGTQLKATAGLEGASLTLEGPGMHCILGPSGSGKSTMFDVIAGDRKVTKGEFFWRKGDDWLVTTQAELAARVTYVHQKYPPPSFLTGVDMLELAMKTNRDPGAAHERLTELLDTFAVHHLLETDLQDLSGGEQSVMELIRALISERAILLADEPTANMDRLWSDIAAAELRKKASRDTIVVVATHDHFLLPYSDSVVNLSFGRVVNHLQNRDKNLHKPLALALKSARQQVNESFELSYRQFGIEEE